MARRRRLTDEERAEHLRAAILKYRASKRVQEQYLAVVHKSEWAYEGEGRDFTPAFRLRFPGWLADGCRRQLPRFSGDGDDWRTAYDQ